MSNGYWTHEWKTTHKGQEVEIHLDAYSWRDDSGEGSDIESAVVFDPQGHVVDMPEDTIWALYLIEEARW